MSLIACEINLIFTWFANCVIVYTDVANQNATFEIKIYKIICPCRNLNHLVESTSQGLKIIFILAFENDTQRSAKRYYLSKCRIKRL